MGDVMFYVWLIVVILLTIVELMTINLTTIWFVISGLAALGLSFITKNFLIQFACFVILGIVLLIISKPFVKKFLEKKNQKTNLDRIIGMNGLVTKDIDDLNYGEVKVDNQVVGSIQKGFVVLVGISDTDDNQIADKMLKKMMNLRIFDDAQGKTNLSLADVGGEILMISQFTLYADCRKGNRPSFVKAGKPEHANTLYEYMIEECRKSCPKVEHGIFGADMKVSLLNDGPFTIVLDSDEICKTM